MAKIEASVGLNGDNRPDDVLTVQRLLGRHNLAPLQPVPENGKADRPTIDAIRHFQIKYVGMQSPDGRVDPDGRTLRKLNTGGNGQPLHQVGANAETRKMDREARVKFVDPRVKETGVTTKIIDALYPHFLNVRARVISGFLSDTDLFWKVNYHWEYLLQMVTHSLQLPVADTFKKRLETIRSALLACRPDPASGYTSSPIGKPEDRSSMDSLTRRHSILSQQKREFRKLIDEGKLPEKSQKSPTAFDLAAAPVAHPGTSKHSTGYALDVEGDRPTIKSITQSHGATLVFDEKSHVHVEFKNGVA